MNLTRSATLGPLLTNPLLAGCSRRDVRRADRFGARVFVRPGRILYRRGEHPHELVIILSGHAVSVGVDAAMESLGPGACVGALAAPKDGSSALAVFATTDGWVLVLTRPELSAMLDECPDLASHLVSIAPS
jgi:CRP-like cAMP-binding protein